MVIYEITGRALTVCAYRSWQILPDGPVALAYQRRRGNFASGSAAPRAAILRPRSIAVGRARSEGWGEDLRPTVLTRYISPLPSEDAIFPHHLYALSFPTIYELTNYPPPYLSLICADLLTTHHLKPT